MRSTLRFLALALVAFLVVDHSWARDGSFTHTRDLLYSQLLRCAYIDTRENQEFDPLIESCIPHGEVVEISGTSEANKNRWKQVLYAREFNWGTPTNGIMEAFQAIKTSGSSNGVTIGRLGRGHIVMVGRGKFPTAGQLSFVGLVNVSLIGAGTATAESEATRLELSVELTVDNADCSGEDATADAFPEVDASNPQCAFVLAEGHGNEIKGIAFRASVISHSEVGIEFAAHGACGQFVDPVPAEGPCYTTHDFRLEDVSMTDIGQNAMWYVSSRDDTLGAAQPGNRSDSIRGRRIAFNSPNDDSKYGIFVYNQNTSDNWCEDCNFVDGGGIDIGVVNIFMGEFNLARGYGSSSESVGGYFFRYCQDFIWDADSSTVATPACGADRVRGNQKISRILDIHLEMDPGNGGFVYFKGFHTQLYIERVSVHAYDTSATAFVVWDGPGIFSMTDSPMSKDIAAPAKVFDFDCNGCTGADSRNLLALKLVGNTFSNAFESFLIDFAGDPIRLAATILYDGTTTWPDIDGDWLKDVGEPAL